MNKFWQDQETEILPVSTPKVRYTWYISVTTIPMDSPRAETSPPRITLHRHPNWTMKNLITTPIMSHENIATMRKTSKYKEQQVLINQLNYFLLTKASKIFYSIKNDFCTEYLAINCIISTWIVKSLNSLNAKTCSKALANFACTSRHFGSFCRIE